MLSFIANKSPRRYSVRGQELVIQLPIRVGWDASDKQILQHLNLLILQIMNPVDWIKASMASEYFIALVHDQLMVLILDSIGRFRGKILVRSVSEHERVTIRTCHPITQGTGADILGHSDLQQSADRCCSHSCQV